MLALTLGCALTTLQSRTARAAAGQDVSQDVAEAKAYTAVLDLNLPVKSSFHTQPPTYTKNLTAAWQGSFDRVAYFLELQRKGEPRRYMWVSMDAFTTDVKTLRIPHGGGGGAFQQVVHHLTTVTNQPGIPSKKTLAAGNIELWGGNYLPANAKAVPGASATLYDTGDSPLTGAGYGSVQVHDYAAKTTLFAYNAWGKGTAPADLGIGNNTKAASNGATHPDWTFRHNAGEYTLRRLRVFVRKGPTPSELVMQMSSPAPHQVIQRDAQGMTWVRVAGALTQIGTRVEARAIAKQGGTSTAWAVVDPKPGTTFVGHVRISQGWYTLQVRLMKGAAVVAERSVTPFGVGEVFITAGQSNSANHGKPPQSPKDQRVGAWGPAGWQWAADPQPIATGAGGSPWPALGDLLVAKLGVPVGFISVGWGGTTVAQWLPGNPKKLFPRLQLALKELGPYGVRGVLWHQGESDAASKTSAAVYAQRLQTVIVASRQEAGWALPWFVARVGYLPKLSASSIAAVVAGQQAVIAADPLVFPGASTDDLVGNTWRHDTVHFNTAGLNEHAKRWAALIPVPTITPPTVPDAGSTDAESGDGSGTSDAGMPDSGDLDSGDLDSGDLDSGDLDSGDLDSGAPDTASPQTSLTDIDTFGWMPNDITDHIDTSDTATQGSKDGADRGCGAAPTKSGSPWTTLIAGLLACAWLVQRRWRSPVAER